MKLPIRNSSASALTFFIEPQCDEFKVPPGGEVIFDLEDGMVHPLEIHPNGLIVLFDNGWKPLGTWEVFPDQQPSQT